MRRQIVGSEILSVRMHQAASAHFEPRPLNRHRVVKDQAAAIRIDGLAGNVGRIVACKEGYDRGHFAWTATTPDRSSRQHAAARILG